MLKGLTALALHLTYPLVSSFQAPPVEVSFKESRGVLRAEFVVETPTVEGKAVFDSADRPYMYDAVEVFVSVSGQANELPYYEFELSPFDQTFQVVVLDPKKKKMIDGVDLGLRHSVKRSKTRNGYRWKAKMEIPLARLGWDGDRSKIRGNAFAIVGAKGQRTFWSLSLPPEQKPNFHRPEFFVPLFEQR